MKEIGFLAQPWPVNFLILIPPIVFVFFRKRPSWLSGKTLVISAIFGSSFGFVEAAVVIYLRAALDLLPGYTESLSEVARQSFDLYQQNLAVYELPKSLMTVELFREFATVVMLVCIALLTAKKFKERAAIFLWTFAAWDIFYYLGLWLTVRWPYSLATPDVLFLIPVPWFSQVWFPLTISILTMIAILASTKLKKQI